MEFLRFIFSGFWVWLGFAILLSMIGGGVIELVKTCKRSRKVTAYRVGERWHVKVDNASARDAQMMVQYAVISPDHAPEDERMEEGET